MRNQTVNLVSIPDECLNGNQVALQSRRPGEVDTKHLVRRSVWLPAITPYTDRVVRITGTQGTLENRKSICGRINDLKVIRNFLDHVIRKDQRRKVDTHRMPSLIAISILSVKP